MEKENLRIDLSSEIMALLLKRSQEKGTTSLSAYVEDILCQIAGKIKEEERKRAEENSLENEEKVKKRLAELGYLD